MDSVITARAKAKRDQIRVAATLLFLGQGYADTSMDAITAEAGISKRTLYCYYPSKDALFADILQELLTVHPPSPLAHDVDRVPLANLAAFESALRAVAHASIANAMQPAYLALLRVIVAEAPRVPHLAALFRAAVTERGGVTIRGLLERAQAAGLVSVPDRDAAARLFAGSLLTYIIGDGLFAPGGVPRPPEPDDLAALVHLFVRACGRGPSAAPDDDGHEER